MKYLSKNIVTSKVTYIVTLYSNYSISHKRITIQVTMPRGFRILNYFG